MKTRKQYMNKEVSHQDYYAQFVTETILDTVRSRIGTKRILKSTDPHFNDIPLQLWDNLAPAIRMTCGKSLSVSNASTCSREVKLGGVSLSDCVCVAKAAAKIIKEQGQ
jgi:hypothetical protein